MNKIKLIKLTDGGKSNRLTKNKFKIILNKEKKAK